MSKTIPRPEKWRGRIYDARLRVWHFPDWSGTVISEEMREEEIEGLVTLQFDNMETARRLFHPSQFENRKRKW